MTLTEAIKHCEDVADYDCFTDDQRKCSDEHRQLADWLRKLKERREKAQLSGEDATFDCISRQAAIDALLTGKEFLMRVLDDTDVVGQDREKYSWGLGLIEECINNIEELTSAEPEPIRININEPIKVKLTNWGKKNILPSI